MERDGGSEGRGVRARSPQETHTFRDLACWQACRDLRLFITGTVIRALPAAEKFRLADQLIRAARSTTSNVAEGSGRYHYLDEAKFDGIARGPCYEVIDHLITGNDEGLVSAASLTEGESKALHAIKVLNGYMAYLKRKAREDK